jgi:hypothetical protein
MPVRKENVSFDKFNIVKLYSEVFLCNPLASKLEPNIPKYLGENRKICYLQQIKHQAFNGGIVFI